MEQHIPKPIWQSQNHHQEECHHGIGYWTGAAIFRNRCVWCQCRSKPSSGEVWNAFLRNEASDNVALQPIVFAGKSLTSTKMYHSIIERETLGILHGLAKFYHYCFTHEVSVITGHKLLVVIFKKYLANISHRVQRTPLKIHQYNIIMLYKPWPQLFNADQVSRHNHETNRQGYIPGMYITIRMMESCLDIPDCLRAEEIRKQC